LSENGKTLPHDDAESADDDFTSFVDESDDDSGGLATAFFNFFSSSPTRR
jgi:hypothetical protein